MGFAAAEFSTLGDHDGVSDSGRNRSDLVMEQLSRVILLCAHVGSWPMSSTVYMAAMTMAPPRIIRTVIDSPPSATANPTARQAQGASRSLRELPPDGTGPK